MSQSREHGGSDGIDELVLGASIGTAVGFGTGTVAAVVFSRR
ncbi:hypothetical protein [Halogeometricum pallidum]|nr:hypothetical protein [Halogeometricum pallidum]